MNHEMELACLKHVNQGIDGAALWIYNQGSTDTENEVSTPEAIRENTGFK